MIEDVMIENDRDVRLDKRQPCDFVGTDMNLLRLLHEF